MSVVMMLAATVGLYVLLTVRTSALLFALGLLLPVYQLSFIGSDALDVVRYGMCLVLAGRVVFSGQERLRMNRYEGLMISCGAFVLLVGYMRGDQASVALGMTLVVAFAAATTLRTCGLLQGALWQGLIAGLVINSAIIVLQVSGTSVPFLVDTFAGFNREVGFGVKSTYVSFELAAGVLLAMGIRRVSVRLVVQLLLGAALFVSGGRGGLLAAIIAIAVALAASRYGRGRAGVLMVVGAIGAVVAVQKVPDLLNTLTRVTQPGMNGRVDITTGRGDLLATAWSSFVSSPALGTGLDNFVLANGVTPHMAVLTFGVSAGILPLLAVVMVTVGLVRRTRQLFRTDPAWGGVSVVLLVWMTIEPLGPLAGLEGALLFLGVIQGLAVVTPQEASSRRAHRGNARPRGVPRDRAAARNTRGRRLRHA